MNKKLEKICKKASEKILKFPENTRMRVVSHYDADGITAAAIISKALYRAGYNIHTSLMRNPFDKGLERVSKEDNQLIIFTDMGSGQIQTLEKMKNQIIIIDHHQYIKKETKDNVIQINANLFDIDGNYDACGATLALSLAKNLDPKNINLTLLALVGATGDKQYIGGITGYNKEILDKASEKKIIKEKTAIKLYGDTISEALYYSIDPYYTGISGNKNAINKLLENLKIKNDTKIDELSKDQVKKLQSFLMFILIKNNCEKNILETVIRKRYTSDITNCELERLADLLDACGKGGNRGLGLAICMGDKNAYEKAKKLEKEYKQKIINELIQLEKDGFKEKRSYRYFHSKESSLGGVIAGVATNFILDKTKPLISIVQKDHELHISCRGNQHLVKKGLDLSLAMKKAAEKLDGHGGGHKIASGATIKKEYEKKFLETIDNIISKQIME